MTENSDENEITNEGDGEKLQISSSSRQISFEWSEINVQPAYDTWNNLGEAEEEEEVEGEESIQEVPKYPELKRDYSDILEVNKAAATIQKYIVRSRARAELRLIKKRYNRRKIIIMEVLETERNFVHHIQVTYEVYWKSLKQHASEGKINFTIEDFVAIFTSSYGSMRMCHETFYEDLQRTVVDWRGEYQHFSSFSSTFLKITPFFRIHKDYSVNYTNSVARLRNLKKHNPEFNELLSQLDKDNRTTRLGLHTYLILPFCRIPRYRMLIKDILKYTEPEHFDYEGTKKALDQITILGKYINNAINVFESRERLIKFHEQFKPNLDFSLISNPRRLYRHCFENLQVVELMKNGRKIINDEIEGASASLFLLSDMLCVAKILEENDEKIKYKYEFLTCFQVNHLRLFSCPSNPLHMKLIDQEEDTTIILEEQLQYLVDKNSTIIKFTSTSQKSDVLEKIRKLLREQTFGEGAIEDSTKLAMSLHNHFPKYISDADCVHVCKTRPFKAWVMQKNTRLELSELRIIGGGKEDEHYFLEIMKFQTQKKKNKKKKKKSEVLTGLVKIPLKKGVELVCGRICKRTKQSKKKKKKTINLLEEVKSFCVSILFGSDEPIEIIFQTKKEFTLWSRALTCVISNQEKGRRVDEEEEEEDHDHGKNNIQSFFDDNNNNKPNDLLAWGRNVGNILGKIDGDYVFPKFIPQFLNLDVEEVVIGEDCMFVIVNGGKVFSWGLNTEGNLGLSTWEENVLRPHLIRSFLKLRIVQISCGKKHTLFLDNNGFVYGCGSNCEGQLGLEKAKYDTRELTNFSVPFQLMKKIGKKVKKISCGMYSSSAILESGECYMWGKNNFGQLGTGDKIDRYTPTLINPNFKPKVKAIAEAALGAWHSLFLDCDGNMYSCGDGSDGVLGNDRIGKGVEVLNPTMIFFESLKGKVVHVESGTIHSGCVVRDGQIFIWGNGLFGQIGNGEKKNKSIPTIVRLKQYGIDDNYKCIQLTCGNSHNLALIEHNYDQDQDGRKQKKIGVYSWGSGTSGRLGNGRIIDIKEPGEIQSLQDFNVVKVFAGGCLSSCVVQHNHTELKRKKELVKECFSCGIFRGKKKQCQHCSGFFCKKCLKNRVVSTLSMENVLLCDVCHKILNI